MSHNAEYPMFQPIKAAAKITGLSEYSLRQRLKSGEIPHIKSGSKYLIDMPKLLAQLDAMTDKSLLSL